MFGDHCTRAWLFLAAKELPIKQSKANFLYKSLQWIKKIGSPQNAFFPHAQIPHLKDHVYFVHTQSFILSEEKLEPFDSEGRCSGNGN